MTKFAWIASAILLQFIAILLFGRGFLPQKPKRIVLEEVNETSKAEICPTEKPSSVKNLVIMVVDAFRDEFLFKSTTMRRTRQLIQSGEAKAFRSHVQSPTVTTPRIKALLSGTVPLFSELLLNFASNEYTEDNWLKRAKEENKRILFYGDEVWMKMLPKGVFEARSEGVDSFYVKDYTDVDNNVTRYLDREFTPSGINSWDILILHYLGLDHVGHSLGGEHPQIDLKLDEMDEIIFNISHSLNRYRSSDEFAFFVLGDHGMSLEGNHGGNSDMETHVPVIVIKPEMDYSISEVVPAALIEQIDLVPVWCALSNTRTMPFDNLGVSFLPVIESDLGIATSGVIQNVKQYIAYLKGYHFESDVKPNLDMLNNCLQTLHESCSINQSSTREKSVKQTLSKCHTLMKITQDEILGPLSNYLHTFLLAGIAVSFIGILMLFIATFERRKLPTKCFWLILTQPFLMFASSFTEEEHDIWYFQLPLIICNLLWNHLNSMDTKSGSTKKSSAISRKNFLNSMLHGSGRWLITILVLHRIAQNTFSPQRRRWLLFPTEKTFDIGFEFSSMINFTHIASHQLLWNTINVFVALATIGTLCFHSVLTSVRYGTKPSQWPACLGCLCILLIKTLNCPISSELLGRVVQISVIWLFISLNFSLAFALWLLYVAKLELYYIFVISWIIGYAFGQISQDLNSLESSFLLHCTTSAAFFYTGNSNSIASIDISVGYAGLSSYQPVLIGLQIVLNAYAGPICVFLGWYTTRSLEYKKLSKSSQSHWDQKSFRRSPSAIYTSLVEVLPPLLTFRSTILLSCLSEFIASNKHLWEGKVILELGAGATALPSLTVLRCGAKEAWITEQCHLQKAFEYIERNINRNFLDAVDKSRAKIVGLNWGCDESIQQFLNQTTQLDFIFGSDVFFDPCVFSPLIKTIRRLLDKFPQAEFYFAYQIRDSDWNIEDLLLLNNLKSSFISQVDTDKHSIQLGKIFASLPM